MALINEARVCGRLRHEGLVDVYRVGEDDGELYIAMQYVPGPDLNSLLSRLRRRGIEVPVRAALDAAIELADALEHALTRRGDDGELLGIVHRDLKPSNVLVEPSGALKISDWGLVKSSLNVEATSRGVVKGTPGYIAPEVWGGTRDFKPSADLFALGAMLYEMIVGERLFRGKNLARIAEQVARRTPEEEGQRVRERCPELEPVMVKILQRPPQKRYGNAEDFAADLRPIRDAYPPEEGLRPFMRSLASVIQELSETTTDTGPIHPIPPEVSKKVVALHEQEQDEPSVPATRQQAGTYEKTALHPTAESKAESVSTLKPGSEASARGEAKRNEPPSDSVSVRSTPLEENPAPQSSRSAEDPFQKKHEPPLRVERTRLVDDKAKGPGAIQGRRRGKRRARGARRRSGPSTGLGAVVALAGLSLLVLGIYAYFGG